jgi:hypothetical protein
MAFENKVFGLNIDKLSADEIVSKIGIDKQPDDQLLETFLECLEMINVAWQRGDNRERHEAYLTTAPTAFEVYRRFYGKGEASPMIARSTYEVNTLHYWADCATIWSLYEKMIDDGYFIKRFKTGTQEM